MTCKAQETSRTGSKGTVFLISLGCAKNLVDSEHILGQLKREGFELASHIEKARIAVVNTCGFIREAVDEAVETILEVAELKKKGKLERVFVAGCLVQRYGYKLKREIPEVDGWVGTGEVHRIGGIVSADGTGSHVPFLIGKPTCLPEDQSPRIQSTPFYTAYLRIAEGCSHGCTYCVIPRLRGPFRSRHMSSVISEAEGMAQRGVKEINLIAQDTTMYGRDIGKGIGLEELLEQIMCIRGIEWIRLMYCHPSGISERLLELLDSGGSICPYLDLPLQHVSSYILRAMGRVSQREKPRDLIARIRSGKRRISIRTTLMVGFPGETGEMFDELCEFVKETRFDRLGVFVFSREKGTAAERISPRVDPEVAEERQKKIMALQSKISRALNQRLAGQVIPVLIEGASLETDLLLTGRTATMAPEVDGRVLINKGEGAAGQIMSVKINETHAYDLVGEIVADPCS